MPNPQTQSRPSRQRKSGQGGGRGRTQPTFSSSSSELWSPPTFSSASIAAMDPTHPLLLIFRFHGEGLVNLMMRPWKRHLG